MCLRTMSGPSGRATEVPEHSLLVETLKSFGISIKQLGDPIIKAHCAKYHEDYRTAALLAIDTQEKNYLIRRTRQKKKEWGFIVLIIWIFTVFSFLAGHPHLAIYATLPILAVKALMAVCDIKPQHDFARQREMVLRGMGWKILPYDTFVAKHAKTVPNFVHTIVTAILKELPRAQFSIEYFDQNFLLRVTYTATADSPAEHYYVFMWDKEGLLRLQP